MEKTAISTNLFFILQQTDDAFINLVWHKPYIPQRMMANLSIIVYNLVYIYFHICSDWTKFHAALTFLKRIFRKKDYPENFIDKCFKKFLVNIPLVEEKVITVERKHLLLCLPYLGVISLQTSAKLQQPFKGVLNYCKLEIVQCGLCNESYYGESIRHLDIRSGGGST